MKKKLVKSGTKASVMAMALLLGAGTVTGTGLSVMLHGTAEAKEMTKEQTNIMNNMSSIQVIGETTNWKYLDDNTDPAQGKDSLTAWTARDFDDSTWKEATGKFGAKRGALTSFDGFTPTVLLNQYKENGDCVPTYFFRTSFQVTNLEEVTSLAGTLYHDDAVIVYINGHKIKSVDMPTDTQENNMFYAGVSAGAPKETSIQLTADQIKEYLVEGNNVISVELHQDRAGSSDIYFAFDSLTVNYNESSQETATEQKAVVLTMGSDETSKNITWYANDSAAGEVQYALKANVKDGVFPEKYQTVKATASAADDAGFYTNQATMKGLTEHTEYVYRLVNDDMISEMYTFSTGDFDGAFSFAFVGDPQIGSGNLQNGIDGWNKTLDVITEKLNPDFLVSAGDQVNTASKETEYAGYLNPALTSLASASTIGNHDSGSSAYSQHFNLPNESADLGETAAGTDYWFVYNNTLFMNINSNDRSNAEHKAFMEEAIRANPDVKWKTVIFHHSIYSTASHVDDNDIIERRNELPQIFDDLDIDVVLMGHDHVYTRTYMMDIFTPDTSQGVQDSVTNPKGILYLTANSASGSKYYDVKAPDAEYVAKQDQSYRRTVTDISVTDTSYTMTTYYADDMSVLDTFTIKKTDTSALEVAIKKAEALMDHQAEYTSESWTAFLNSYDAAVAALKSDDQTVIDEAAASLDEMIRTGLQKIDDQNNNQDNNSNSDQDNSTDSDSDNTQDNSLDNNSDNGQNNSTDSDSDSSQNNSTDNDSDNTQNVSDQTSTPKTMDPTNAMSMGLLMTGAGSAIAILIGKKRKLVK